MFMYSLLYHSFCQFFSVFLHCPGKNTLWWDRRAHFRINDVRFSGWRPKRPRPKRPHTKTDKNYTKTATMSVNRIIIEGNQSSRHTVNSSQRKMVWRVDRRFWRRCDDLTVLLDLAFVTFKSFAVVGDFKIAHAAMTCHVVHECATSCFFQVSTATNNCCH